MSTYVAPSFAAEVSRTARLVSRSGKYWKKVRVQGDVKHHPPGGTGELRGVYPSALTTVEGVPVSAQVFVRYRANELGGLGDGALVAVTESSPAGEWDVQGVNGSLVYDVFARYPGENDALQTRVSPNDLPRFYPARVRVVVGAQTNKKVPIFGGVGAVTCTLESGALPDGLSFIDGNLVGSWPTGDPGIYTPLFALTDMTGTYHTTLEVELVLLPLVVLPGSLPDIFLEGDAVSVVAVEAEGGEGPYVYAVSSGSLPAGLSLESSTGVLSGTASAPGDFSFVVTATDSRMATASLSFTAVVTAVTIPPIGQNVALGANVLQEGVMPLIDGAVITDGDAGTSRYGQYSPAGPHYQWDVPRDGRGENIDIPENSGPLHPRPLGRQHG